MRHSLLTAILSLWLFAVPAFGQTAEQATPPGPDSEHTGVYYVAASALNVRFGPGNGEKVAKTLPRGEKVYVFEVSDGWARISKPFNGKTFDLPGTVAYWVSRAYLTREAPGEQQGTNP